MAENLQEIILSVITGTVDPTTVTPDFIGQGYLNTSTNILFFAKSLTIGDYEEIIDINSTVATQAHDQNTDTKLDDGEVNEVTSSDLRIHLDNLTKHRLINDGISTLTNLYSASQIDALIVASTSNLDIKNSVVTVADSNVTLSGEQTINGVLTSASRVGVVGQTLSEQNGIYITSSGAWTRATDADENSEVTNGLSFFVSNSGSTKNGNQYILITLDPIVLDTTPLTFIEVPRIVLGTTSGTATEGDDPRIPTQDENDALIGTNGTPSSINKYVTDSDVRLHTQNTDTILTTNGVTALLNAGILKINLLSDDAVNIQIDEIRARDGDGLKLNDDGGNGIFIEDGGNIGIGIANPLQKLHTFGTLSTIANRIETSDTDIGSLASLRLKTGASANVWQWFTRNGDFFAGIHTVDDYLVIKDGGNIGINNDSPNDKLDVIGNIRVSGNLTDGTNSVTPAELRTHLDDILTNPHDVTKTQVGLSNVTNDSQLKRSAGDLNSFPSKANPDLLDVVIIEDSADSFNKKKIDLSEIKGLVLDKARFFLPNTNTSGSKGNYLVATLGANASINLTFKIPSDFVSLVALEVFYIVNATVAGQNIDLTSDYALAGQILNFNSESLLAEAFSGTIDIIGVQDIAEVFTGLVADHICGLTWKNNAIGTGLNILGIKLRYE